MPHNGIDVGIVTCDSDPGSLIGVLIGLQQGPPWPCETIASRLLMANL